MNEFQSWLKQREQDERQTTREQQLLIQQAEQMASFCLTTGVQPSEYKSLTLVEIESFIKEVNRRNKQQ